MSWEAEFSQCGEYRYVLRRKIESPFRWVRPILFIMLNPSTADAQKNDATIKKCIKFAKREGATVMTVVNLFAYRSTDPKKLEQVKDPVGELNDEFIEQELVKHRFDTIICAWGANKFSCARGRYVLSNILNGYSAKCFKITKNGNPSHPLYIKDDEPLKDFK